MSMVGKLTLRDGKLCVMHEYPLDSEPAVKRLWWVVLRAQGNQYAATRPEEGDTARYAGHGTWNTERDNRSTGSVSTGNGNTQAIAQEFAPVLPPKVRAGVQLRWHNQQWEKLSTRKGWIPA